MNSLWRTIMGLLVWGAALYGVLQIGRLSEHVGHTHDICGPWGCGPPIAALVAWHGFWLVLVGPLIGLMIASWPASRLRVVGLVLLAAGVLMLIGIVVWEAITWLPLVAGQKQTYFVQRVLFSLVTLTDVPFIPITLAGLAMYVSALITTRPFRPTPRNCA